MSSLRGEQALKDGLSFEFTWTARHLIEVLEERALSIQLGGQPGESGVDFRIEFPDHEEHHQVKRAFGTSGEWKLSNLDAEGVLHDFRDRLADSRIHCHFVSSLNAVQLGYLANRARSAEDFESYSTTYLSGEYEKWFSDLVRRWGLPEEECWLRLKRVFTRVMDEREFEESSLTMLRSSVEGNPQDIWVHLKDYCFSHLNKPRRASDLWQWLETKNYKRQLYAGSPRIVASLAAQTESYLAGIRRKLIKPPFSRLVSATIIGQLVSAKNGLDVVVLGAPGGGKSAVMLETTDSFVKRGWPVLAFRLDELSANSTAQQLQAALNLPVAPAKAISLAAAGLPALVVIDQLDAVSHYSGRTSVLFDRVAELVHELRAHRLRSPIHVLIACRDIDWKHDGRFRQLHRPRYGAEMEDEAIHKVEELTNEEISSILKECGLDAAAFSPRQYNELLRRPQYLALFIEANVSSDEISKIITPKQLFDAYWRTKDRAMAQAFPGASTNHWAGILKLITGHLSETASKLVPPQSNKPDLNDEAPLAVLTRHLESFPRTSIDWMITNGVIVESGTRIRFGHESLFDYCFARFFEERGQSLLEYLCQSDQTLIQRGQLRQVMAYMRDNDTENYVAVAKELLESAQIRPHLKLLLTVVLCSAPDPSDAEWHLICSYVDSAMKDIEGGSTTTLACHMFYAFHGSLPFFNKSVESGAFSRWLSDSGPLAVDRLFRVLLKHQDAAQQKVWQLMAPLLDDERFDTHFEWFSQFCKASQSRETFEWLLTVMKKGFEADDRDEHRRDRFYSLCDDLEKRQPIWLAEWIAALIDERANSEESADRELIKDHAVDPKDILSVATRHPREFVTQVLPAVIRAFERCPERGWNSWRGAWEEGGGRHYVSTEHVMFDSLTSSLTVMLTSDLMFARKWLGRLSEVDSTTCRSIRAAVLCHDHPGCVEMAVEFLAIGGENFAVSYAGNLAACKMIETHVSRFSDAQLARVEAAVLNYYPPWQNGYGYGIQRKRGERPSCAGTNRGYAQMNILKSFPDGYLSNLATTKLKELERKFHSHLQKLSNERNESREHVNITKCWKPQRYLDAIMAKELRGADSRWPFDGSGLKINDLLRQAIKDHPSTFVEHIESLSLPVLPSYVRTIAQELVSVEMAPALALRAATALRQKAIGMSREHLYLLAKVPASELPESDFEDLLAYLTEGSPPELSNFNELGKRGDQLHSAAINSIQGHAIRVLVRWIWDDPGLVAKISVIAEDWMRDPNPAIRAEMASLCYAIAFKDENRPLAQKLFTILASDSLPEDEVLASHWPWKFMHTGLGEHWDCVGPIIEKMTRSKVSEVRASGARLACIGLLAGCNCFDLAYVCVRSNDPNVRIACANIASHNLNDPSVMDWMRTTFMELANDSDKAVCRSVGQAFYGSRTLDFGQMGGFLAEYVKTRAFLLGPRALISSIEKSSTVLPNDVFGIVRTLIGRLSEPVDDSDDRLAYHIDSVSAVLKRLYHENRDGAMRREALDLIDELCLRGSLSADSLDQ